MARLNINRKSGFIRRAGGMVRDTLWIEIAPTNTNLPAASTAVLFNGLAAAQLTQRPFTVVRTRIGMHIASDQVGASESYQAALGLAVVSDQALAIGVTAVPTPFTDIGSDLWFFWAASAGRFAFINGTGTQQLGLYSNEDSKAMRKVEEGQDLAVTVETSAVSLGADIQKFGRLLIKLH